LTGFHLGGLAAADDDSFHGVGTDGTVNKRLVLELGHGLLRLEASLNVHASSFSLDKTQLTGQRIEKKLSKP
jgi:hypothetical protein